MLKQLVVGGLALFCAMPLQGFRDAKMRVPEPLEATAPLVVQGHQVRTLNAPMTFGDYRIEGVEEGYEFSWSVEAFGVRGGSARQRYRFVLTTPEGGRAEVECRNRAVEAWRNGLSVELTEAFAARLSCGIRIDEQTLRLVLGSRLGLELVGTLTTPDERRISLRSLHRLEGSPLRLDGPAGYVLEHGGSAIAAVETLNRGRVWLTPGASEETQTAAAAAIAALLLYEPELTPQID